MKYPRASLDLDFLRTFYETRPAEFTEEDRLWRSVFHALADSELRFADGFPDVNQLEGSFREFFNTFAILLTNSPSPKKVSFSSATPPAFYEFTNDIQPKTIAQITDWKKDWRCHHSPTIAQISLKKNAKLDSVTNVLSQLEPSQNVIIFDPYLAAADSKQHLEDKLTSTLIPMLKALSNELETLLLVVDFNRLKPEQLPKAQAEDELIHLMKFELGVAPKVVSLKNHNRRIITDYYYLRSDISFDFMPHGVYNHSLGKSEISIHPFSEYQNIARAKEYLKILVEKYLKKQSLDKVKKLTPLMKLHFE